MAIRGSADVAFVLLDGQDILGTLTELTDTVEATIEDTTVLGAAWKAQFYTGVKTATLTQQGFWDSAAGSIHDALSSGPGISKVMSYGVEGTATGARVIGWEGAMQVNYQRLFPLGELFKANANYQTNGNVDETKLLRTYKAAAATGRTTGAPVDNAVSATGGVAYLQYNAAAGEANFRVLHSSDNVTYATLITFTKTDATSAIHGAERIATTAVVERYLAVDVTTATATGSIGAMNYMVSFGRGISA